MIAIFDEDGGGDVDFQEFVSGLSAFSSKGNKEEKLRFAFKVYDIDRDGFISNGELFIVLKMMVGSNLKDQQLQQVCAEFCIFSRGRGSGRGWKRGGYTDVVLGFGNVGTGWESGERDDGRMGLCKGEAEEPHALSASDLGYW